MDGRAHGIDVSHHNGVVDWTAAAAAGIHFGFAKASEGSDPASSGYTDHTFATNWQGMLDNGVVRGAYHFIGLPLTTTPPAKWNDDLHSQIDHFLELIGPPQVGDLPPVLDLENGDSPTRWQQLVQNDRGAALAVVRELIQYTTEQLAGIVPIIYTGTFWRGELGDPTEADDMSFGDHPLWMPEFPRVHTPIALGGNPPSTDLGEASSFVEYAAKLDGHTPTGVPTLWGGRAAPKWAFWQFSSMGQVPGVSNGRVDLDVFNGTPEELDGFCIAPDPE